MIWNKPPSPDDQIVKGPDYWEPHKRMLNQSQACIQKDAAVTDFAKAREAAARALSGSPFPSKRSLSRVDATLSAFSAAGWELVPKVLDDDAYLDFDDACGFYLNGSGEAEVDAANKAWGNLLLALKHKDGQP